MHNNKIERKLRNHARQGPRSAIWEFKSARTQQQNHKANSYQGNIKRRTRAATREITSGTAVRGTAA